MRNPIFTLVALFGWFALITFLFFRDRFSDPTSVIVMVTVIVMVWLQSAFPSVGRFISAHPRAVFWTGIAIVVGGIVGLALAPAVQHTGSWTHAAPLPLVLVFVGIFLVSGSRNKRDSSTLPATPPVRKPQAPTIVSLSGVQEAWRATRLTVGAPVSFLRLVGVWAALLWALPYVGTHIALLGGGVISTFFETPTAKIDVEVETLVELLLLFAVIFVVPVALVAWHRYVLADRMPPSGLPRPDNGIRIYRMWFMIALFLLVLLPWQLAKSNSSDLAHLLGAASPTDVFAVVFGTASVALLYLCCPFALAFPAAAEGRLAFPTWDSVREIRYLGTSFRVGFILSLLPFGILTIASTVQIERARTDLWHASLAQYALLLVPIVGCFLALANCATYISLVYAMRPLTRDAFVDPASAANAD
jgi:hypothetical protein